MPGSGAGQRTTDQGANHTTDPARGQAARLSRFFERLCGSAFFGKVVVSFQNGRVSDVRIEETRKLEEL